MKALSRVMSREDLDIWHLVRHPNFLRRIPDIWNPLDTEVPNLRDVGRIP